MNRPNVVSLFSGTGGLDLGFESAGFHTSVMLELTAFGCATLRKNFPDAVVIQDDIRQVTGQQIAERLTQPVDVLIGGPPCQSFSIAAAQRFLKGDERFKRVGFQDPVRGTLIEEYLRILSDLMPKVFLIENVPGILDLDDGETIRGISLACQELGYSVAEPVEIQTADFGTPQYRRRVLILGALGGVPELPRSTHHAEGGLFGLPHVTVAEALFNLNQDAMNHVPRAHRPESLRRYKTLQFGQREHLGRVDRLDPCKPSKTVIAGGSNGGGRSHLHPFLARTLTVRESARLQTFPDDFEFLGTMSRQFTQVGNAVPPLMAELVARSIGTQFFGMSYMGNSKFQVNPEHIPVEQCVEMLFERAKSETDLLYYDLINCPTCTKGQAG